MHALKIISWAVGSIVVGLALIGGYFGFVPGVSALFGSDQPRDLGATHTPADLETANQKFRQQIVPPEADPNAQLRAAEIMSVDATLTPAEFAAHLEAMHPVSDVQLKLDPNGTFEASGRIVTSRIPAFARTVGFGEADIPKVMTSINRFTLGDPPFYLKGRGQITADRATAAFEKIELGRFDGTTWLNDPIIQYAADLLDQVPGLEVESLTVENGNIRFKGTTPAVVPEH